jgi:hypothetical protein
VGAGLAFGGAAQAGGRTSAVLICRPRRSRPRTERQGQQNCSLGKRKGKTEGRREVLTANSKPSSFFLGCLRLLPTRTCSTHSRNCWIHVAFTSWIQIQLDRAKDCKLSSCARQRSVCLIAVMPKGLLFPFALSAYPFSSKSKAYLFRQPLGVSITTFNLPVFRSNGLSFLKNFIRGIIKRTAAPMRRAFLLASALQNKLMLGFRILTLCAAAQQEDQEQNRKWNSQKPKKNVPCGPSLFNFFFQFHRDSIQFS